MYSINMIAKKLGIPQVTIRAWESRYGVVTPDRTEGGHRVYSEDDLRDLIWLKEHVVEKGVPISQAAKMLKQQREKIAQKQSDEERLSMSYESMSEHLYNALLRYDNDRAHAYIDLCFSMFHYEDVFHNVLVPILKRVGREWHDGAVLISQEHFATQFVRQRILEFSRLFPVDRSVPKCIAFCPSGESHQIGLLLFTLFLQKHGHEVLFLGANTSFEHLLHVIRSSQVQIVCVSVTDKRHFPELKKWIDEVEQTLPHVDILVGGLALTGEEVSMRKWMLGGGLRDWEQWYAQRGEKKKTPSRVEKGDRL
jgi:DNA-binding transcriptional MerR regulator